MSKEFKKDNYRDKRRDYNRDGRRDRETSEDESGVIYGRNAVLEALKGGQVLDKLFVQSGEREGSITLIIAKAKEAGVPVLYVQKEKLDHLSNSGVHQGVVAMVAGVTYRTVDELLAAAAEKGEAPFLVIADGVEDPHNLGAIIRSAEGAGAHGLIIAKRHASPVTPTVIKASAGAAAHLPIAKVTNLATAIDALKKAGLWIYGAEAGGTSLYQSDLRGPAAFVVGSEGKGISHLIKEKCDFMLSIPMYGQVNSFNVSCAAAVVLCYAAEQRHQSN